MLLASGTYQAVMNILASLLNGARLCPFHVKEAGVARFAAWLIREEISIYHSSASLFRGFAGVLEGTEDLSKIRHVRLASETVTRGDVELFRRHFPPDTSLTAGLSSTETGMLLGYDVGKDTPVTTDSVPIGYPLEDMDIFLLDDDGKEIEDDCVGEIAVSSRYLSPGYWRRPELTALKFRPDPRGTDRRIYLTGDLGRRSREGCLEHLGRNDFLVKVRGYRVETGEVENRLLEHPAVKETAVVGERMAAGESRLLAYFVPADKATPNVGELRNFLKSKLPDYMIPSVFYSLAALPRTIVGKVDRHALPAPDRARPKMNARFVAPQTGVERELAKIWAEILSLDQVGIEDDFFELGGHSLTATVVLFRVRESFQVDLPLRRLFEAPTVAALACTIEAQRTRGAGEDFSIASDSSDPALVSFGQERLWFIAQLEPGSAVYNVYSAVQLTGWLDVTALQQSFDEIVRRHEVLRTVFDVADGHPVQIVLPFAAVALPVVDLRAMVSNAERESEARRLCVAEIQQGFDLARGPLLRVRLFRLADDAYRLLMIFHHIVFDGWSAGILARELSALYPSFASGAPASLPPPPIQYANFAQWQRGRLDGAALAAPLAYWKKQLRDLSTLQLYTDHPRPPVPSARGARQHLFISNAISAALKSLSRKQRVTFFMTLTAAFQTLLHRYTGQDDIVIGSPVAGRNRVELESLIGFFLNMVVLRTDLSGNPTFSELLGRVRKVCLEAYAGQDVPFEKLVEELQPERDLSRNPLFQVTFTLQNSPRTPFDLAGLATGNDWEIDPGIARFDLHLFLEDDESGLKGYLSYSTDLFDAATIARMIGHFQILLEGIVADPDRPIGTLLLLAEGERCRLLVDWNDTARNYPRDRCIHELFEAQADRTPDAAAVVFEDERLSYRELNLRANRLAHHLRKRGVGPEVLVGICMERSLEMVIALLGILKAGGAYVPLDPAYPKERLAFMLQDAHVPVLLTETKIIEELPEHTAEAICLDTAWDAIALESVENPTSGAKPENLAYVIYTSGSTGQPKGAMNTHLGICNRLLWMQEAYRLNETDRVLQKTPFSFDVSVWEFFWPLLTGAQLVVARPGGHQDSTYLVELIAERKITTLHFVPSMLQTFLEQPGLQACNCLRRVICGGEALTTKLEERFFSRLGAELHNLYGPTEAAVDVTYWACRAGSDLETVPIGRPIANTQIYILDPQLRPVPIGIPGELHIGGVGVARGYLNRPELSAEKFIPNSFSDEPGARLYRTGDLARYLPDGNVEFLGRIDNQVKLRGFRIELGEIEAQLGRHPGVRETVVALRDDEPEGPRLVAYVVPAEDLVPTAGELRGFLKLKLPDYMAPSAFVFLGSLPLMANGKLDRRALPAPDTDRPGLDAVFIAPRTAVEKVLSAIWCEVLGLARVAVQDNFFDLGGHSLRATQVVLRVRDALNVEFSLKAFFEAPTIAGAAAALMQTPRERLRIEETAQLLLEVAQLSEDEARKMLDEKTSLIP